MKGNLAAVSILAASLLGCSDNDDGDSTVIEEEALYSIDSSSITESGDGISIEEEGAVFKVTTDSEEFRGIFVRPLNGNSDSISINFNYSSESATVEGGDNRLTLRGVFFNSLADGGVGTGENGNGGNAVIRLSVRNQSDGTRDVLACASIIGDDGSLTSFVEETEDGDGDGCAGLDWTFDYDTDYELSVGINRDNQSVIFSFDGDSREYASTVAMFEPSNGFQELFVSSVGVASTAIVSISSISTDIFTDTEFVQFGEE